MLLVQEEFENWAEPPPTGRSRLDEAGLKNWMTTEARQVKRQTGEKPLKDDLVRRCVQVNGCSEAAAARAFRDGVPSDLKRGPTELKARTKLKP